MVKKTLEEKVKGLEKKTVSEKILERVNNSVVEFFSVNGGSFRFDPEEIKRKAEKKFGGERYKVVNVGWEPAESVEIGYVPEARNGYVGAAIGCGGDNDILVSYSREADAVVEIALNLNPGEVLEAREIAREMEEFIKSVYSSG